MRVRRIAVKRTPEPWPGLVAMCEQQAAIDEADRLHNEEAERAIERDLEVDEILEQETDQ